MKAIVRTDRLKRAVSIREVDTPEVGSSEVSIRVHAAGVCGSDVGAYLGKPEYDFMDLPAVLGHEFAGVVDGVGDAVRTVEPGDRVVVQPGSSCGSCFQCLTGEENNCPEKGVSVASGGFAPYSVARADRVLPVPDEVSLEHAALTEPLAVTRRAVIENGEVSAGDAVLVQGPGPMGAFSALVARAAGADVLVTGLPGDAARLDLLSDVGIETMTVSPETDQVTDVAEHARRDGFDVCVDATGAPAGVKSAVTATREGGNVVVLGIVSEEMSLDLAALVRSGIHLRTSHGATERDFLGALDLLRPPDALSVDVMLDRRFSPHSPSEAFDAFAAAETIKPLFDPRELAEGVRSV
jgi:2-desacetyl-2-hydroxyethyl bacteriochlorophyllide A dehydrogenase